MRRTLVAMAVLVALALATTHAEGGLVDFIKEPMRKIFGLTTQPPPPSPVTVASDASLDHLDAAAAGAHGEPLDALADHSELAEHLSAELGESVELAAGAAS